jgi:hypothetical protein
MQGVTARLPAALALACLGIVFVAGAAAAPPSSSAGPTTAAGFAISIVGPDGSGIAGSDGGGSFAYPGDGFIASAGSTSVDVGTSEADGTASARTELSDVSIFGGEITVSSLKAVVSATPVSTDLSESAITNLIVLGQSVSAPSANASFALGDWGSLSVLRESTSVGSGLVPSSGGTVTALVI